VAVINPYQVRITEACLYSAKELPRRIGDLQAHVDAIMPPLPGSVLKLVGRPVAKTPVDTSQTERWGIRRACCPEAEELAVKLWLWHRLQEFKSDLGVKEKEFIALKYDHEKPTKSIVREMGITERKYYHLKDRVVRKLWQYVQHRNGELEVGVQ
jgi:hypothetical protein